MERRAMPQSLSFGWTRGTNWLKALTMRRRMQAMKKLVSIFDRFISLFRSRAAKKHAESSVKLKRRKLNFPLPDGQMGQEIQVLTKYQEYAAELLRLALLLLAGYGLVLQEITSTKSALIFAFQSEPCSKYIFAVAISSFCICAAMALGQRIFATNGYEARLSYARLLIQHAHESTVIDNDLEKLQRKPRRHIQR